MKVKIEIVVDLGDNFCDFENKGESEWFEGRVMSKDDIKIHSNEIGNELIQNPKLNKILEFVYSTRDVERRAYVAQFYNEIKNVNSVDQYVRNRGYREIITYQYYLRINQKIDSLINALSDDEVTTLKRFINSIGLNFAKTNDIYAFKNRFIKYIENSTKDMLLKLDKVAIEYLNDNE